MLQKCSMDVFKSAHERLLQESSTELQTQLSDDLTQFWEANSNTESLLQYCPLKVCDTFFQKCLQMILKILSLKASNDASNLSTNIGWIKVFCPQSCAQVRGTVGPSSCIVYTCHWVIVWSWERQSKEFPTVLSQVAQTRDLNWDISLSSSSQFDHTSCHRWSELLLWGIEPYLAVKYQ